MEDQYFFFQSLWKVDQSWHGQAKESHFKLYHSTETQDEQLYSGVSSKAQWK